MIEARGLSKRFGNTLAVDDLSFIVDPGKVTGFLGPNGAGKTTTLRMILGLDRPTSGTVTVNGKPYRRLARPVREVGALLDTRAVPGGRSAYEHLRCLALAAGLPERRVHEVVEVAGLGDVAGRRTSGFSQAMEQRVGIAAALLGDPGILIFDEPANGLDPEGIRWVRNLMKALAAEGRTVFVSSHRMPEMQITADHLIVIGRGRLIADCPVAEFISRHSAATVQVRTPQPGYLAGLVAARGGRARVTGGKGADDTVLIDGLPLQAVGDLAFDRGVRVHELAPARSCLQEAFVDLTAERPAASGSAVSDGAPAAGGPACHAVTPDERAQRVTAGSSV